MKNNLVYNLVRKFEIMEGTYMNFHLWMDEDYDFSDIITLDSWKYPTNLCRTLENWFLALDNLNEISRYKFSSEKSAMSYLHVNDPTLKESLNLALKAGIRPESLDSTLLASLHNSLERKCRYARQAKKLARYILDDLNISDFLEGN